MFGHAAEPGSIRMSVVDQGLQPYAFAAGRAGLITVTLLVAKVQARAFQLLPCRNEGWLNTTQRSAARMPITHAGVGSFCHRFDRFRNPPLYGRSLEQQPTSVAACRGPTMFQRSAGCDI
jgi:hypothetical protein